MHTNLNTPTINAGPLTAADLVAARKYSTGRVLYLHRAVIAGRDTCAGACETHGGCDCATCPPCNGNCSQGRDCPADACAAEGGKHRDPAPTKTHRPGFGVVLVLLGWPVVAALVAAVAFIAQHMG